MSARSPVAAAAPVFAAPVSVPGPTTSRISPKEGLLVGLALLVGIALRLWQPGRFDVEHFDEGVYAANEYSAETEFEYPFRYLYAPPLFPELASWGVTFGRAPVGAVWVSLLGGILMVPVVWWTARSWFGPIAGVVVVWLAATSEYHIWLSRAALTDVWLCLWMTAGAYAGWRALLSGRPLWLLAAGGMAALAWWTKYNGWLTLAVIGGGWLVAFAAGRLRRLPAAQLVSVSASVVRGGAVALAAGVLWSPVWKGLAPHGGYAAVAKNHAGYFVGLAGWPASLVRQIAAQQTLPGPVTLVGLAVAAAAAVWLLRSRSSGPFAWRSAGLAGLWFVVVQFGASPIGAVGVTALLLVALDPEPFFAGLDADGRRDRWLAWGFAAAWLAGLSLAVPMYRAYPRLSLPWLVATWLAVGAGVPWVTAALTADQTRRRTRFGAALLGMAFLVQVGAAVGGVGAFARPGLAWEDRTGLRDAAPQIREAIGRHLASVPPTRTPQVAAVLYVIGEPALFCHLAAEERRAPRDYFARADATLGMLSLGQTDPRVPTYLVLGGRAARTFRAELDGAGDRLIRVPIAAARESHLVRLDEFPPWSADASSGPAENGLECYYLQADR